MKITHDKFKCSWDEFKKVLGETDIIPNDNIKDMNNILFITALRCAVNPMDEKLLRVLCLEASKRLSKMTELLEELLEMDGAICDGSSAGEFIDFDKIRAVL